MEEREKHYTSLHDISPREYLYFPKGKLHVGQPGSSSRTERIHLSIAILTLSLAFSFVATPLYRFQPHLLLISLPLSFIGILFAFAPHELAHKILAQHSGLWAEFRMYPQGLILALTFGFFLGFVVAAPGAVVFRGHADQKKRGVIAASGPTMNTLIAGTTLTLFLLLPQYYYLHLALGFIALINILLATYNLIPYGILDGVHVFQWNKRIWGALFLPTILLFVFTLLTTLPLILHLS